MCVCVYVLSAAELLRDHSKPYKTHQSFVVNDVSMDGLLRVAYGLGLDLGSVDLACALHV